MISLFMLPFSHCRSLSRRLRATMAPAALRQNHADDASVGFAPQHAFDQLDLLAWGQHFLPQHFALPPSRMHRWLAGQLDDLKHAAEGRKINVVGPRGSAKSTLATLAFVLREAVSGRQPYLWIVSDTIVQAATHLDNVKAELLTNQPLAEVYPRACGIGPVWRRQVAQLRNGVLIEAIGTGQRVRGRRHRAWRPTLIVCDDLQHDAHMHSAELRELSRTWFHGLLLKAGNRRTHVVNLGTALHREALAMELTRAPGWRSKIFQAIETWPTHMELWSAWEELYVAEANVTEIRNSETAPSCECKSAVAAGETKMAAGLQQNAASEKKCADKRVAGAGPKGSPGVGRVVAVHRGFAAEGQTNNTENIGGSSPGHPPVLQQGDTASEIKMEACVKTDAAATADIHPQLLHELFYRDHQPEMHEGARVLWPEHEDLLTLMTMRAESGHAAFEREKQSSPVSPEFCEWPAEYFGDEIWFSEWPRDIVCRVIALDPSKGSDARRGDFSAFVLLGLSSGGTFFIEADLARRATPQMVADGVELCRRFRPSALAIESNQFQELLGGEFLRALAAAGLPGISPVSVENRVNKQVRIRTLGPHLARRRLKFLSPNPGTRMLVEQLRDFPLAAHDDGPDALELALRVLGELTRPVFDDGLGNRLI